MGSSILLHVKGKHTDIHKLKSLYDEIGSSGVGSFLNESELTLLEEIDRLFSLRYPPVGVPTEIGTDDWDKIDNLMSAIYQNMPQALQTIIEGGELYKEGDDTIKKGRRVLMRKPVDGQVKADDK
jgi:hypothetical protein